MIKYKSHCSFLEVNLDYIYHNIKIFKKYLYTETKIMAMVKANSYGIGSIEVSKMLENINIDYLGVAYSNEGVLLRKKGINLPIIVLNPVENSCIDIINYNLEPGIYSLKILQFFIKKIKEIKYIKKFFIHIKIDSGMHRLGFEYNNLENLLTELSNNKHIYVKSIFSHLSDADVKNSKFTINQINKFENCYNKISIFIGYKPIKHILNSHGIIHYSNYQFDMVRIGIGMYGYINNIFVQKQLKNVITLKTQISQIIHVKKGETVGYNQNFYAKNNMSIATLAIGYADGLFRKLGNGNFYVLIKNKKAKIVGSICMDMMMVNINNISCHEGDEVIIYGNSNTLEKISKKCDTIPYEILTSISNRIKRIFIKK